MTKRFRLPETIIAIVLSHFGFKRLYHTLCITLNLKGYFSPIKFGPKKRILTEKESR